VIHGMLAAIGILIFAKQFPVLLGVPSEYLLNDPAVPTSGGLNPIGLYSHIPTFIAHATPEIAFIGIASLIILFGLPLLGGIFKKIPAPMVVLVVMIVVGIFINLKGEHPKAVVSIGDFWGNWKDGDTLSILKNVSFAAIGTGVFWKYIVMFLFVNSLESLLTVKAIDGLDPYKRKSDYNKDLRGLAVGNGVAGLLGGLPMISEVARSAANVANGAKTRWANFFHGLFLLISLILLIPVIEMIPNAALAAMLIFVAYRLASPKEFIGTYKVGPEQLVIFLVTIFITVYEDLLMGVAAGIIVKFVFHILNGAPLGSLFKARYTVSETAEGYLIHVEGAATFSNFLGYKKLWSTLKPGKDVTMDFSEALLVDHSFMEQLHLFEEDRHHEGSQVTLTGLDKYSPLSSHPLAARKISSGSTNRIQIQLSPRAIELRKFAYKEDYNFYPQRVRSAFKYKDFPIEKGNKIQYEENFMEKYNEFGKISISDITLTEGARQARTDTRITVVHISETDVVIPDFTLEPEGISTKLSEMFIGKDIDFNAYPEFSKLYYLRGSSEAGIRKFFAGSVIKFLEQHKPLHVECHKNRLLFYKKLDLLSGSEIQDLEKIAEAFLALLEEKNLEFTN
jgi:MFS superfamily sulfate permease-like transporter